MALWTAVQALPTELQKQVYNIYGTYFPIEIRHYLAEWIENSKWEVIDPENGNHQTLAMNYLQLLLGEIEATALRLNGLHFLNRLPDCALQLQEIYLNNPLQLIRVIGQCLQIEKQILQKENNSEDISTALDTRQDLFSEFEPLKRKTQEIEELIRKMRQEQEVVILEMQKTSILNVRLQQIQDHQQPLESSTVELITRLRYRKNEIDQNLNVKLKCLQIARKNFQEKFQETFQMISELYNKVIQEELRNWKIRQKLAGNGYSFYNNLDQIQELCELLAEILWQNCQQIKQLQELHNHFSLPFLSEDQLPNLNFQFRNLLSSLVKENVCHRSATYQVIKTNGKFCAAARLLVGRVLNVQMTRPQVKVQLINETQANEIIMNKKQANKDGYFDVSSAEILNNTGTLEMNEVKKQLCINFKNLSLKNVKRSNKKAAEVVTDEKFSLLFQSIIKIGDGESIFHVWTMSVPVVVIVHGSQESPAWATVTWDNEFSEIVQSNSDLSQRKSCFAVPETVPWPRMAQVLSVKFQAMVGKNLHEQNLNYLASKIFNGPITHDDLNMPLSWSQFCKDYLPNRNFTFWEWLYAIIKLTKEHLQGLWNDGLILGFVDRNEAENMLQAQSGVLGTFLLRFSDSELGGVTVACLHCDPITEFKQVLMLEPFTAKKLLIRSLADSLNDIKSLLYLFPNVPKDVAFSKYYSKSNDTTKSENGYRKLIFVAKILGPDLYQEGCPTLSQHLHELDINVEHANAWSNNDSVNMHAIGENEVEEEIYPSIPVNDLLRILQTNTLQT